MAKPKWQMKMHLCDTNLSGGRSVLDSPPPLVPFPLEARGGGGGGRANTPSMTLSCPRAEDTSLAALSRLSKMLRLRLEKLVLPPFRLKVALWPEDVSLPAAMIVTMVTY